MSHPDAKLVAWLPVRRPCCRGSPRRVLASYALVFAVGGRVYLSWSGLIHPGRDIPEEATAIHGITSDPGSRGLAARPDPLAEIGC
jgi:hypothetical protein